MASRCSTSRGLNLRKNTEIDLVEPKFMRDYARGLDRPDADAVFICCGALRTLDIVGALEDDVGKPAVVSNQAMMWDCLRLAGIEDVIPGYGSLLALDCAAHRLVLARESRAPRAA